MSKVVAVLCSDIHLSHTAPIARSAEPDWYEAMRRPLRQLREIQTTYGGVPVVIAGDIFDKWNAPAELINFAYDTLPKNCFAIPGQHDLPGHSYDSIKRSAYWTLFRGNVIESLPARIVIPLDDFSMMGFPWNEPLIIEGTLPSKFRRPMLAVIHKYVWYGDASYQMANKKDHVNNVFREIPKDYFDSFVIGDNHKRFLRNDRILNCGGFMRRKIDEIDYTPSVGLLHKDGTIKIQLLDCSEDMFIDDITKKELGDHALKLLSFIDNLQTIGNGSIDFVQTIKEVISKNKLGKRVAGAIIDALEQSSQP